jgi:hypothetical protein
MKLLQAWSAAILVANQAYSSFFSVQETYLFSMHLQIGKLSSLLSYLLHSCLSVGSSSWVHHTYWIALACHSIEVISFD